MRQLDEGEQNKGTDVILYDCYAPAIFAYLYQQGVGTQDAEDVVVEVFMAALGYSNFIDMPAGEQLAWLRQVARNKMIDRYRRDKHLALLPLEWVREVGDKSLTPEQQTIQQENYERLYESLAQLSDTQQQIVRLRYGNGLRLVEIAGILNKPEGTVRKLLFRTLRHLRAIYEQEEGAKQR